MTLRARESGGLAAAESQTAAAGRPGFPCGASESAERLVAAQPRRRGAGESGVSFTGPGGPGQTPRAPAAGFEPGTRASAS